MSVIEKLDSVVKLCDAASAMLPTDRAEAAIKRAETAAADFVVEHGPAIRQAMIDAERYRWLRDCDIDGEDAVMLRMSDFGRDELLSGEELDAAIDARLASDSATGEGEGHD